MSTKRSTTEQHRLHTSGVDSRGFTFELHSSDGRFCSPSKRLTEGQTLNERTKTPPHSGDQSGVPGAAPDMDLDWCKAFFRGSDTTVISFAGLGHRVGAIPDFEYERSLASMGVNIIMLRDPRSSWYTTPLRGFGRSFPDKVFRIAELLERAGGRSTHVIGSSAGGLAALLFACFVPVTSVTTMGGQTNIREDWRALVGDDRWSGHVKRANDRTYGILLDVADAPPLRAERGVSAFVGSKFPIDVVHGYHAKRVFGDAYRLYGVEDAKHGVAPELKSAKKLFPLLERQFVGGGIDSAFLKTLNKMDDLYPISEI